MIRNVKYNTILPLAVCGLLSVSTALASAYTFPESSRIAEGKWIKFNTESEGVTRISYDQLRAMGFKDPSKVGVFGRGGRQMPHNFTDAEGTPVYSSNPEPVATYHHNNAIYFYALGTDVLGTNGNLSIDKTKTTFRYTQAYKNIYTDHPVYFLSDNTDALFLDEPETVYNQTGSDVKWGHDYVYYEEDLVQNNTNTGNLFWGPSFVGKGKPRYEWDLNLPFLDIAGNTTLDCQVFASKDATGTFSYGIDMADGNHRGPIISSGTESFSYQTPARSNLTLDELPQKLFVEVENGKGKFINLDRWIFTYSKSIPDFSDPRCDAQERLVFSRLTNTWYSLNLGKTNKDLAVFRLTGGENPTVMYILNKEDKAGNSYHWVQATSREIVYLVAFDTNGDLPGIADGGNAWSEVSVPNIHQLAQEGADLIILSVPKYRKYAEEIAELHREYDGMKVLIFDPEDMYNEMSQGLPDPMAYRALAKLFNESPGRKLNSMLLIGPAYCDYRGMEEIHKNVPGFIGYQGTVTQANSEAANAMDYYGLTVNYIDNLDFIHECAMNVGIGLLPVNTEQEAERMVRKIREYITDDTQAWRVNETLGVGGLGDNHTHDKQTINLGSAINSWAPERMIHSTLCIDAYGEELARRKMEDFFNRGKLFTYYFGHGGPAMLGKNKKFFTIGDAYKLNNEHLGIIFFGGCTLSRTDFGERGLGELMVTDSRRGLIATILATRTTWSGQNYDFANRLVRNLFRVNATGKLREKSPTLGEWMAGTKTESRLANELYYILIGDPAIRVPVALSKVNISDFDYDTYSPGSVITVSGTIDNRAGGIDREYNGKAAIKILYPSRKEVLVPRVSSDGDTSGEDVITYEDDILVSRETEVKNGQFTARLVIPADAPLVEGDTLPVYVGTYDRARALGASGRAEVKITRNINEPGTAPERDRIAPEIDINYADAHQVIEITVSDNESLVPGIGYGKCLTFYIDDTAVMDNSVVSPVDDAITYRKSMYLHHLPNGKHTIKAIAVDAAGNTTETVYNFSKQSLKTGINVKELNAAHVDEALFEITNDVEGPFTMLISDKVGNPVAERRVEGPSFAWDGTDDSGKAVTGGLYRMRLMQSSATHPLYSDWVEFGLLD